jgi:predicted transcriptional regulator
MIESLPRDRAFTFSDVLESMEALEPSRTINETSVRTLLPKLETQGIIRRVSKNQAGRVERQSPA